MTKLHSPTFYNKEVLKFILNFEKDKLGKLKKKNSPLNDIDNVIVRQNKKDFTFEFDFDFYLRNRGKIDAGKIIKNIEFEYDNNLVIVESMFIGTISPPKMKGSVYRIHSDGFSKSKKQYWKFVIPILEEINIFFTIERIAFSTDRVDCSIRGTQVKLNGEDIYIIHEKDENKNEYLIIESRTKQSYKDFSDLAFVIRIALGYVTGSFVGNKGYFFSYSNRKMSNYNHFYFTSLRKEIQTLMYPLNTNPYAWVRGDKKYAERLYNKKILRPLSILEFSNLCNKLKNDDDLIATLLLIIESGKASLIFRPSAYSIALETLSDIIIGDKKLKLAPINSKQECRKFRKELNDVLSKYSHLDSFRDVKTLKGRIEHINQMTNSERLKAPFDILGIDLLEEDLKVISSRNDFLHGRVPDFKGLGNERSIELKDNDLYYATVRLYTLLNTLIFKMIGFDNYILNFAKIYENDTTYKVKESYHKKV